MSTPLIGKVSVHGNDEENYELMKGAWVHGLKWGTAWTVGATAVHLVADKFSPAYQRIGRPRHVLFIASVFCATAYYYGEKEELRLIMEANKRRLLPDKIRMEQELQARTMSRFAGPKPNHTPVPTATAPPVVKASAVATPEPTPAAPVAVVPAAASIPTAGAASKTPSSVTACILEVAPVKSWV